jgi:hypothetical protein
MEAPEEPPHDLPIPHRPSRALRRSLFVVLCLGVFDEFALLAMEGPNMHGMDFNTSGRSELGFFCGFGMLLWCITFRKAEKYLGRIGWFIALIALLLPGIAPAIN